MPGPPHTPVWEFLVVAVFLPRGQRVEVVAAGAVLDHVVLEAGADTGLGKWGETANMAGGVPTPALGEGPGELKSPAGSWTRGCCLGCGGEVAMLSLLSFLFLSPAEGLRSDPRSPWGPRMTWGGVTASPVLDLEGPRRAVLRKTSRSPAAQGAEDLQTPSTEKGVVSCTQSPRRGWDVTAALTLGPQVLPTWSLSPRRPAMCPATS